MKTPDLIEGMVVALLLALLTAVAGLAVPLSGASLSPRVLLLLVTGAYVTYLAARAPDGAGRIAVPVAWLAISLAAALLTSSATTLAMVQLGLVWLLRSVLFQRSSAAIAADLALLAAGAGLALTALLHGHSPAMATWCLLLVQAPFGALGTLKLRRAPPPDAFEAAANRAEAALAAATAINPVNPRS